MIKEMHKDSYSTALLKCQVSLDTYQLTIKKVMIDILGLELQLLNDNILQVYYDAT